MQCVQCGNTLKETAKICIRCGTAVSKGGEVKTPVHPPPAPPEQPAQPEVTSSVVEASAPVVVEPESVIPEAVTVAPVMEESPMPTPTPVAEPPVEPVARVATINPVEVEAVASAPASSPKVEVAPEFAATLSVSATPTKDAASPKNNIRLLAGGAVLVVVAVAAYVLTKPSAADKSEVAAKASQSTEAPSSAKPVEAAQAAASSDVLAASSTMSKEVLNQILAAAGKGEWDQVNALLMQSKPMQFNTVNRNKARQLNQKGLDALKQSQFDDAVAQFKSGITEDPNDAEIKNNLAFTYIKMKQFDLGRSAVVDSLLVSPTRGAAWLNAAEIFAELNNAQIASQALRAALHFANNKQKAIETLSDDSKVPSEKLRAVIKSTLPDAEQIPSFKRN